MAAPTKSCNGAATGTPAKARKEARRLKEGCAALHQRAPILAARVGNCACRGSFFEHQPCGGCLKCVLQQLLLSVLSLWPPLRSPQTPLPLFRISVHRRGPRTLSTSPAVAGGGFTQIVGAAAFPTTGTATGRIGRTATMAAATTRLGVIGTATGIEPARSNEKPRSFIERGFFCRGCRLTGLRCHRQARSAPRVELADFGFSSPAWVPRSREAPRPGNR